MQKNNEWSDNIKYSFFCLCVPFGIILWYAIIINIYKYLYKVEAVQRRYYIYIFVSIRSRNPLLTKLCIPQSCTPRLYRYISGIYVFYFYFLCFFIYIFLLYDILMRYLYTCIKCKCTYRIWSRETRWLVRWCNARVENRNY